MSSASGHALQLAGDLFLVIMLISIGVIVGRMSTKMSRASSAVINQQTIEYLEADVSSLLANEHTGIQVKNYVNKYRRDMQVTVTTLASEATTKPILKIDAKTSTSELNDSTSKYYISNDAIFTCSADRDTNGYFMRLKFKQVSKDQTISGILPTVETAEEARMTLISMIGGNTQDEWKDIVPQISEVWESSKKAKADLVKELNTVSETQLVSESTPWYSIVESNNDLLKQYSDIVKTMSATDKHNMKRITLDGGNDFSFDFTPTVLIVNEEGSNDLIIWTSHKDAGWVLGTPSLGIVGNLIKNTSDYTTYVITAYN